MNKKSWIIVISEILILVFLIILVNSNFINIVPKCWIYENTGVLCPGCGGTRCVINILQGNIVDAFFNHMVFFITFMYLFILNIIYIINLNKKDKIATWIYPKLSYVILFVILLISYTIIRNLL